ncbi:MAG: DNA mismatch repair endonuclease MutL [Thermodesulfobacteriota bacterium]
MKRPIRVLPQEVIDQIAAGEVVERPASVIKELLDNSLDASSSEIVVRAGGGGITMIEVSDNGVGMGPEEVPEAFRRHSTSKIETLDDLQALKSLGFRGEALHSIASVSRLEMVTRVRQAHEGTKVVLEGGSVKKVSACGCPPGTRVLVEDLFFNVPARRKFIRSKTTEAGHLKEVVQRTALANPGVGFYYEYEGKRVLDCPPVTSWSERIRQILGKEVFGGLWPVLMETDRLSVRGHLSHPNLHRASATGVWVYVNRRPVQDRGVLHALMRGYGPLLERGRYPVAVLLIEVDPREVDVNVHPAKQEVRFRDPQRIYELVMGGVRRLMREQPWATGMGRVWDRIAYLGPVGDEWTGEEAPHRVAEGVWRKEGLSSRQGVLFEGSSGGKSATMEFLGQIGGTYLIFSGANGLLLVDQHAAHERVLYERLQARPDSARGPRGQGILWDEVVELDSDLGGLLEGIRENLGDLGWEIEPFGRNSWRIRAVPPWMDPGGASELLREILREGLEMGSWKGRWEDFKDRILARLACHGAVKGGDSLDGRRAMALLEELRMSPAQGLCPHGRPTMVEISWAELERRFGRSR